MTNLYTDPFGPPWRFNWARLVFQWRGSILQFFWVELLVATGLCAIALTVWLAFIGDEEIGSLSPTLRMLFASLSYIGTRFQAALSLMLGFYTGTLYNRWWKVRDVEGVVIGRINDLAPQIAALVREQVHDEKDCDQASDKSSIGIKDTTGGKEMNSGSIPSNSITSTIVGTGGEKGDTMGAVNTKPFTRAQEVRMHLVRYLNLSHALTVGELYEKKPNEFSTLENIRDFGLLTDPEFDYMARTSRSRYVAPFVWFLDLVSELKDRDECGISEATMLIFAGNITKIRGSLADLYMYRNVPVPLAYRQLVNITVRMYMVLLAVVGGLSILSDIPNEPDVVVSQSVYWTVLPFFFEYFMFVGWLSLADALGNPFRSWADEFEWENYVRTVCLSSNLFITECREASPSVSDLAEHTASIATRQSEVREKWLDFHDDRENVWLGVREVCEGHKYGLVRIRKRLTGF